MTTGTVEWLRDDEGFGFVVAEDGSKDLFVHHSEITGAGFTCLTEGAKVSYVAQQGATGAAATQATPL